MTLRSASVMRHPSSSSSSSLPTFAPSPSSPSPALPTRMVLSACAGMGAACFCHPLDVIRVQMQVNASSSSAAAATSASASSSSSASTLGTALRIARADGIRGLYSGITAAFLRQWLYGSCRMGIFSQLLSSYKADHGDSTPPLPLKMLMGMCSGGIGAFVGTPSEVALVRMGADGKLPVAERRNYKNVFDCVLRMAREEGLAQGPWKGATVTVIRAMVMGSFQMGFYSETKERLVALNSPTFTPTGVPTMFSSALVASFFANGAVMPFDVVKSRIQNMPKPEAGKPPIYAGMLDCARKSVAEEGVLVLWRGFTPAFIKLAPYTVLSLTFLEKLTWLATGTTAL